MFDLICPPQRSLSELARHNSKDFDLNGGNGSIFGSRSGSRRGSILTAGEGSMRNGSLSGIRLEEESVADFDSGQQRKVGREGWEEGGGGREGGEGGGKG